MADFFCWRCRADLKAVPQPFGRRAECPACQAELHVCRMCRLYDPSKANACRERAAEAVANKTRANFCDWFQARPGSSAGTAPAGNASEAARKELDDLFGPT